MYDGIHIVIRDPSVSEDLLQKVDSCIEVGINKDTGEVQYTRGRAYDWFVRIGINGRTSIIRGSLHKFYNGGQNDTVFTFSQVKEAVNDLINFLGVPPSTLHLTKVELGINIPAECPKTLINAAMLFHGVPYKYPDDVSYGRKWCFSDYSVKLYEKGPKLVRYEIRFERLRKLCKNGRFDSVTGLAEKENFTYGLKYLYQAVSDFTFVPGNFKREKEIPIEVSNKLLAYRDPAEWAEMKPWGKTRARREVDKLIEQYDLINWKAYLRKHVIRQGALMLDITPEELIAMFSTVCLEAEMRAERELKPEKIIKLMTAPAVANNEYDIDTLTASAVILDNINAISAGIAVVTPWSIRYIDVCAYTHMVLEARDAGYAGTPIRGPPWHRGRCIG